MNQCLTLLHSLRRDTCKEYGKIPPLNLLTKIMNTIKEFTHPDLGIRFDVKNIVLSGSFIPNLLYSKSHQKFSYKYNFPKAITRVFLPARTSCRAYSGRGDQSMYPWPPRSGGVRTRGSSPRHGSHPYPSCPRHRRECAHWRCA